MADAPAIAIVLAGQRRGAVNPLAARAGVTHKCLAPIAGKPVDCARPHGADPGSGACRDPHLGRARCGSRPASRCSHRSRIAGYRSGSCQSAARLSDSLVGAALDDPGPFIVTTADNVLLTPAAIAQVRAALVGADAVAAMARKASVLAAHPEGQRNFYRFRDDEYANCNIYALANRKAIDAGAEVFRGGGQFMKSVWRMIRAFGLHNIVLLRLGAFSREAAMRRLSGRLGLVVRAIEFTDGSLAVDVDNERTYRVCEELLAVRNES
jgi:hypothetical protein